MKNFKLAHYFYLAGLVFLLIDIIQSFQLNAWWEIIKDFIFILIILYMVFIYPKRKLYLTDDMSIILFLYFSLYGVKSYLDAYWVGLFVSLVYVFGIISYKLYRKKRKYSVYLKK